MIEIVVPSCTGNAPIGLGRKLAQQPCPVCDRQRVAAYFAEQHPQLVIENFRWPLIVTALTPAAEMEFRLVFSDIF